MGCGASPGMRSIPVERSDLHSSGRSAPCGKLRLPCSFAACGLSSGRGYAPLLRSLDCYAILPLRGHETLGTPQTPLMEGAQGTPKEFPVPHPMTRHEAEERSWVSCHVTEMDTSRVEWRRNDWMRHDLCPTRGQKHSTSRTRNSRNHLRTAKQVEYKSKQAWFYKKRLQD